MEQGRGKELSNEKWSKGEGERKCLPAKVVILKNPVCQPTGKSVLLIGAARGVMIDTSRSISHTHSNMASFPKKNS